MPRRDPLRILDAVYAFDLDERAWMRGVIEALAPYSLGRGVAGYVAEIGETPAARAVTLLDTELPPQIVDRVLQSVPSPLWRRMHAPMPAGRNVDMMRSIGEEGFDREELSRVSQGIVFECWGAIGGDVGAESVLVAIPCAPREPLPASTRRVLDFVAAHLGAAIRLRRLLGRRPASDDAHTEALLSPDGKLLDVRSVEARDRAASLAGAVRLCERARSRKADPDESLALWTALVEGRWSIVQTEERDGRRVLLACRNEPRTTAVRRLEPRERTVAQLAALGHPYKYIAYELGVSVPSVAATLKRAMRKLGLRTRVDLVRTFSLANRARDRLKK